MSTVGYARVGSVGQSLEVQLDKLKGCNKVFEEKKTATSSKRPQLSACLDYLKEGDTLVVTRLDRLARSTLHLCQVADRLQEKGVNLKVIDQNIDTSDAAGRSLFDMLRAIAQFETEIRAERQMDGIRNAKARSVYLGKRNHLSDEGQVELPLKRQDSASIKTLMQEYNLSKASVYRYLDGITVEQG